MQIDKFLTLAKKRRSIRRFKPDPIPDAYIEKIIEAARWAMSGANAQPWEFIVVKDQQTKNKIGELYLDFAKRIYTIETTRIEELRHQGYTSLPVKTPGFVDAPVLIIVCGDPRTLLATVVIGYLNDGEGGPKATFLKNMANATQMLQLAVAASGLGSQWLSVDQSWEGKLKAVFGVPDELEIHTIVPIGYPDYEPPTPYRRELGDIVHYEKYDRSKFRTEADIVDYLRYLRQMTRPSYIKALS